MQPGNRPFRTRPCLVELIRRLLKAGQRRSILTEVQQGDAPVGEYPAIKCSAAFPSYASQEIFRTGESFERLLVSSQTEFHPGCAVQGQQAQVVVSSLGKRGRTLEVLESLFRVPQRFLREPSSVSSRRDEPWLIQFRGQRLGFVQSRQGFLIEPLLDLSGRQGGQGLQDRAIIARGSCPANSLHGRLMCRIRGSSRRPGRLGQKGEYKGRKPPRAGPVP